jgi:hypothetical protein
MTDLYQCHVLYDRPNATNIGDFETELIEMLAHEYVEGYEFGFKNDGKRVLSFRYKVGPDGGLHGDANGGGIYAQALITGASYYNYMSCTKTWWRLTDEQRATFKATLPVQRVDGYLPQDGAGYWQTDHGYSAGGVRLARETFRPR